ncbi:hypothetical protein FGF1_02800 [Flavobacteriaceae bacterium GF1]
MKKQLHLMIATIFVVLVGISSYGQQFTVDGIRYEITATAPAKVEVVDYIGATTEVTIPSTVQYQHVNYTVTAIGKDAFRHNQLTSVTIPNSVTRIESYAFRSNQLTSVTIPNSVARIESYAFAYNNLTEVTIPNGLDSIGDFAFYNNQLTSVTLPNSVTSIGDSAFLDNKLTNVTIPNGVTSIEDGAFAFNELASVTIPNGVTSIGNSAFLDNKLTSVTIPESVTRIDEAAFMANQLQGHLDIPDSVTEIIGGAFYINQLTSIKIPSSVTIIGQHAFTDNLDLHLVMVERDSPPTLDEKAFKDLTNRSQIDLIVPKDRVQAYLHGDWTGFKSITEDVVDDTFISDNITYKITEIVPDKEVAVMDYDTSGGTSVDIPSTVQYQHVNYTVTAIGDDAFKVKGLTSVTLPNTLTRIGDNAFQYNQLKGHLEIPNSVTSIGSHAFGDNQLTRVTIPEGVTHIGEATFAVNQLTSVTLPNSLETIGNYAFQNNQLTRVTIPNNVASIGTHAFQNNQLTEVTLPNNLTSIGNSAFWHNDLTGVTLPSNVTRIDQWAFWDNLNLAMVTVKADSPPTLDKDAFKNRGQIHLIVPKGKKDIYLSSDWTDFKSITEAAKVNDTFIAGHITYKITEIVPDKEVAVMDYDTSGGSSVDIPSTVNYQGIDFEVNNIGEAAFAVNQLTSVTIPSSVTRISNYAFQSNQLTEVNLPNNLTSIGTHAFQNNQLTSVTLPNSLKTIGNSAFWHNDLTEVTLPVNVTRIDQWAFWDNLNLAMVTVKADSPPTLDKDAFKNRGQIHLIVPKGRLPAYSGHPDWTGFKSITEDVVDDTFISDNITYKITKIVPDKEVAVMDYDTSGSFSVDIPPMVYHQGIDFKVTSIDNQAFMSKNLIEVNIPDGVTRIGHSAFQDNQLTEVIIPNSVTRIENSAFGGNQLIRVVIPNGVMDIGKDAFYDNQLTSVELPTSVDSLGQRAFGDNHLTSVTIPDGVTRIEKWTFAENDLKEVTIPGLVESIGDQAFYDNPNLNLVTVKRNDPPSLYANAFQGTHSDLRHQIDLVVPEGARHAYSNHPDWTGFKSITEDIGIGDTFISDNITYKITETVPDKKVAVMDYDTSGGTMVTIPPMVAHGLNTYTVTAIGKWAFYVNNLTSVTIPNTVTVIGESAFENNQLTSVVIPNGVMDIGKDAFYDNQLTSVELPTSVDSLGQRAFGDNHLTSVTIPDGVTRIEKWTFAENNLKEVTIPGLVESIGYQAFYDNPNLGLVTVKRHDPPSLDADAFQGTHSDLRHQIDLVVPWPTRQAYSDHPDWTGFRSITEPVERGNTFIADNIIYKITKIVPNKEVAVVDYNTSGGAVIIPPTVGHGPNTFTVTSIGDYAFYENQLTGVTIPDGVTSIGEWAFRQNNLTEVTIPNTVTSIGDWVFSYNRLTEVTIPDGVPSIGEGAFNQNQLTEVTIGNSVTSIGDAAFSGNQLQGHLEIPDSVRRIGYGAFPGNQLTSVTIGNSVTSIGDYAFSGNQLQGHLEIPDSVTNIGDYAFYNNQLTRVTIGNSVTSIGDYAFDENQLTEVTIGNSVASIGEWAFSKNQLTEVTIPDSVTSIEYGAFSFNQLTSVTIGNGIESIGGGAFAGNWDLVSVWIKAAVPPTIEAEGFDVYTNKINLIVPLGSKYTYGTAEWTVGRSWSDYFTTISTYPPQVGDTFLVDHITYRVTSSVNLYKVKVIPTIGSLSEMGSQITIPPTVDHGPNTFTVTSIGEGAFYGGLLTEVTIPNSVTDIGDSAFASNPNLETVTVKATNPPSLHAAAFQNRDQIDLIVPVGRTQAYEDAGWTGFKSITESAMTGGKSAVAQGTSAEASPVESAVAPAHVDVAKANARNNVSVYPNPAQDNIHIGLPDGEALRQVNLYNALGVHVHSANTLQMDISHLSSGTYVLEIETRAGERVVKRILVK